LIDLNAIQQPAEKPCCATEQGLSSTGTVVVCAV
jgi:hypothetical protein